MFRRLIGIFVLFGIFFVSLQSVSALNTYIGVKILNLTDDPAVNCAGLSTGDVDNPLTTNFNETAYDFRGRIRSISSILPEYPVYFELSRVNDSTMIWSGNGTDDTDYEIGDIMYIPQTVDLDIGVDYKLFFDVDAIRMYLPLVNYGVFEATQNDNYWTIGKIGTGSNSYEYTYLSNVNGCTYGSNVASLEYSVMFITNNRSTNNFISACMTDNVAYCNFPDVRAINNDRGTHSSKDFRINKKYENLYTSSVGNFQIQFTFS